MKNVVHIVGTSDGLLKTLLDDYMHTYKLIIADTAFGARVVTFSKNSVDEVGTLNSAVLTGLFNEGISLITYFGHSSATTLEFNLDNPANYNNVGKYPLFVGLGCNAGDFFKYNLSRLSSLETISERYVLDQKGTIGFVASTHFGIVHYLDIWNSKFYNEISNKSYSKSIGEQMKAAAEDVFGFTSQDDFYARCNIEESELQGDPAIHLNTHAKPDYVIEDPMVKISPAFISVSDRSFRINAKLLNIGKAVSTKIVVEVKQTYPNKKVVVIARDTIPGIRYADSLILDVPIVPDRDKGLNKITITIDADNVVDELYETNNSITKDVIIYDNEASPVYPSEFAIINKQNIKLKASTANPFMPLKQYRMELDTTQLFNSPFKVTKTTSTVGGVMEFDPGITFSDSTVYYWRVAPDTTVNPIWNTSSFIYLPNSDEGYNQSHYFQHLASTPQRMMFDNSRKLVFDSVTQNLFIKNGVFLTATVEEGDLIVSVNGIASIRSACVGFSLIFNVFDQKSFKPWFNTAGYAYGSGPNCDYGRQNNFEFSYMDPTSRKKAMDFMDTIPNGAFVVVRNILNPYQPGQFAPDWMADTTLYGPNNDLYHKLKAAGMANLDSFYSPKAFAFVYQKGSSGFTPVYNMSLGLYDEISMSANMKTPDTLGMLASPQFGPAKEWKQFKWAGNAEEVPSTDDASVDIIGVNNAGVADTLFRQVPLNQPVLDISSINASQYPFIQLYMHDKDTGYFSPYQLRYWRLTGTPAPEGAVAPNIAFQMNDTVEVGQPVQFKLAFKNISDPSFDSIKVKIVVTDRNNVQHIIPIGRLKPLVSGDTALIQLPIDTKTFAGANNLMVEVNPDSDQPEQYHFNNMVFKQFFVRPDTLNPLMDVTFDNVHILNHDIVSAKPNIVINLKDNAKWLLLNDKSVMTVQVVFPDKTIHSYNFNGDTLQFVPATNGNNNQASAIFKPIFTQDGEYQLIVSGQDMSSNKAGAIQYKVAFDVINKPMISNMLNYPNPFT
ncbi:MAG TPA: C25 family cysteine peptidase, partial [Flavisolibacter sp.]|nr:C25 family cysteine peptidase [Flavisolibacter sp.]